MMISRLLSLALVMTAAAAGPARAADEPTLRGSPASMVRQNQVAKANDYSFLRTEAEVRRMADRGYLERVRGNADWRLANVSFPFTRPEIATFLDRLGAQYREGCGERLVVTSLTRPLSEQPGNAHQLSVHPAGMAVDLRISRDAECRAWLERTLLALEARGLLDVTRERTPPHYHVAVFTDAYRAHVERMAEDSAARADAAVPRDIVREVVEAAPVAASLRPEPKGPAAAASARLAPARRGDDDSDAWAFLTVVTLFGIAAAARIRRKRWLARTA
ncbi:MAG TPA: DUF5715 family protein [Longimicrobium sp.]|nr:DUF5715 family protein [Longimicrobium sp.]